MMTTTSVRVELERILIKLDDLRPRWRRDPEIEEIVLKLKYILDFVLPQGD